MQYSNTTNVSTLIYNTTQQKLNDTKGNEYKVFNISYNANHTIELTLKDNQNNIIVLTSQPKKEKTRTTKNKGCEPGELQNTFIHFSDNAGNNFKIPTLLLHLNDKYIKKTSSDFLGSGAIQHIPDLSEIIIDVKNELRNKHVNKDSIKTALRIATANAVNNGLGLSQEFKDFIQNPSDDLIDLLSDLPDNDISAKKYIKLTIFNPLLEGAKTEHNALQTLKKTGIATSDTRVIYEKDQYEKAKEEIYEKLNHNADDISEAERRFITLTKNVNKKFIDFHKELLNIEIPMLGSRMINSSVSMTEYYDTIKNKPQQQMEAIKKLQDSVHNSIKDFINKYYKTQLANYPNTFFSDKYSSSFLSEKFFYFMLDDNPVMRDAFTRIIATSFAMNNTDIIGHPDNTIFCNEVDSNGNKIMVPVVIDGGQSFLKHDPDYFYQAPDHLFSRFLAPLCVIENMPYEFQEKFIRYYHEALFVIFLDRKIIFKQDGTPISNLDEFKLLSPDEAQNSFLKAKEVFSKELNGLTVENKLHNAYSSYHGITIALCPYGIKLDEIKKKIASQLNINSDDLIKAIYKDFDIAEYKVQDNNKIDQSFQSNMTVDEKNTSQNWSRHMGVSVSNNKQQQPQQPQQPQQSQQSDNKKRITNTLRHSVPVNANSHFKDAADKLSRSVQYEDVNNQGQRPIQPPRNHGYEVTNAVKTECCQGCNIF